MRWFVCTTTLATAVVLNTLGAAHADVRPVPGLVAAPCAGGFYYSSSSIAPYMCRTPPIKCPPHPNGFTGPLNWDTTAEGHRFRYLCATNPGVGLKCATGFSPIVIGGTYECRTPFIKCPPRGNVPSFTQAMPWLKSKNGALTFEYRCRYH